MKVYLKIRNVIEKVTSTLDYVACFMICILCAWVVVDVVGRNLVNNPIPGTAELAGNSVVAILFLEIAFVEMHKKNLRSDILISKFGNVGGGIVELISSLFGLIVFSVGFKTCINGMFQAWKIKEYDGEGSIHIPAYLFKTVVVIGCAFMIIALIFSVIDAVLKISGKEVQPTVLQEGGEKA